MTRQTPLCVTQASSPLGNPRFSTRAIVRPRQPGPAVCGSTFSRGVGFILLVLAGCGLSREEDPSRLKRVPVSGVVKYQGQPVEHADVSFLHVTANSTAYGKTDSAGRFVLTTFVQNDGTVPGPHVVTIRRMDYIDKTPPGVDLSAGHEAPPPEIRWIIPQDYSHPDKSGLKADVSETGPNDFHFDLK